MNTEQAIKQPMEHRLKCWPEYFKAVKEGLKPFEVRKWDRPYAVGDTITLEEWDPETADYTGDAIVREITYLLDLTYLPGDSAPHLTGHVALGLNNPTSAAAIRAQTEREKKEPCEYCDGVPSRYKTIRAEGFYQTAADEVFNPETPVCFCPNCGRKLDHEPKEVIHG